MRICSGPHDLQSISRITRVAFAIVWLNLLSNLTDAWCGCCCVPLQCVQRKRVPFPEGRVNDDHMLLFLGRVEDNSVYAAPFMDACTAQMHMTMDLFVAFRLSDLLEHRQIICK